MNYFEQANRARRVRALVAHFDRWVADAGHCPRGNAGLVAETLTRMLPRIWALNAAVAGLKSAPSGVTRRAVVRVYLDRAAALAAPRTASVAS